MINWLEPPHEGGNVSKVHIYTDGSANRNRSSSAWGIFLIQEWSDELDALTSPLVGPFSTDRTCSREGNYIGGLNHLQKRKLVPSLGPWIIAEPQDERTFILHTDSLLALNSSNGEWKPAAGEFCHEQLTTQARNLFLLASAQGKRIETAHVKAHTGTPGNEAVDGIAWATMKGYLQTTLFPVGAAFDQP